MIISKHRKMSVNILRQLSENKPPPLLVRSSTESEMSFPDTDKFAEVSTELGCFVMV